MENYGYFTFQIANNKGADQTAQMRRLVYAFVVRKQQSQRFSHQGPYNVETQASWPPSGYVPDCLHLTKSRPNYLNTRCVNIQESNVYYGNLTP